MTLWIAVSAALLVGGMLPALWLGSRGDGPARLVGLQLAGAVAVLDLLCLSVAFGQSSYLIVPLTLVVLAVTGTLVFTRLLGPRP
jgi:multisubunit Na+/H+ antiporter MnhF subunit